VIKKQRQSFKAKLAVGHSKRTQQKLKTFSPQRHREHRGKTLDCKSQRKKLC
jgi:hypothetical protein